MTIKDSYFTISQAAKELGVTRQTVSRWISDGDLEGEKIGRETIIHKSEVENFKLQKMVTGDIEQLAHTIIGQIKDKYDYLESDKVDLFNFKGEPEFGTLELYAETQDNGYDIVSVIIGRPERIGRSEDNSIIVGMKVPIVKIERHKSSKEEIDKRVYEIVRRKKSK